MIHPIYRRLLRYTKPYWPFALIALLSMVAEAAASAVFVQLIKPMLDDLFIAKDAQVIRWLPVGLVVLFALRGFASYFTDVSMERIGRSVVRDLRQALFEKYQTLPTAFFARSSSGGLISKVLYDVEQVANATSAAVKNLVLDGLYVVAMIAVMMWHSASLTLYMFMILPLTALVWRVVGKRYRRLNRGIQSEMGAVAGFVEEAVDGHREVRIYQGQARETERFSKANESNLTLSLKIAKVSGLSTALIQTLAALALAAIIWRATRPDLISEMSPGTFMSLISAMLVMLPSIKRLTTVQSSIQKGVAAAKDVFAVLDETNEPDQGTHAPEQVSGRIEFKQVTMTYPETDAPTLVNINLVLEPGNVTALVGPSGSGKTTTASLIPRFYPHQTGQIYVDDVPIGDYSLQGLRQHIAWVGQNVVLFDGSIADNIAYGGLSNASEADIVAAATAANAMEFIERLPDGLNTRVGEGGALLSGGQRQRIAIARAILKDAPILILDEATSALDAQSEHLVQQALMHLIEGRTTLIIAHRFSTIEHADHIVVFDHGKIAEEGDFESLLHANGLFSHLYHLQKDGEQA